MSEAQTSFRRKRFRWRPFASFGPLWSFVLSALAGIALYLRPEGSLASWSSWSMLGLDKNTWEGVHTLAVLGCCSSSSCTSPSMENSLGIRPAEGRRVERIKNRSRGGDHCSWCCLRPRPSAGGSRPAPDGCPAANKKGVRRSRSSRLSPDAAARSLAELCSLIPSPSRRRRGRLARGDTVSTILPGLWRISPRPSEFRPSACYRLAAGR
jgi:hypothetical protein